MSGERISPVLERALRALAQAIAAVIWQEIEVEGRPKDGECAEPPPPAESRREDKRPG
jgi:hypothetical protein